MPKKRRIEILTPAKRKNHLRIPICSLSWKFTMQLQYAVCSYKVHFSVAMCSRKFQYSVLSCHFQSAVAMCSVRLQCTILNVHVDWTNAHLTSQRGQWQRMQCCTSLLVGKHWTKPEIEQIGKYASPKYKMFLPEVWWKASNCEALLTSPQSKSRV